MKILLVHNRYQQHGGEDSAFEAEKAILENNHHDVKTLTFDNHTLDKGIRKIRLAYKIIYNFRSRKRMEEILDEFRPDVIHIHNLFYVASPSIIFPAYKRRIPLIMTLHNFRLICSGGLLLRDSKPCELCVDQVFPLHGIKYACHRNSRISTAQLTLTTGIHKLAGTWTRAVTRFVSPSEFGKSRFIHSSLNVDGEKIAVKPSSVKHAIPAGFDGRENFFLFVGRLSREKGIEVLLDAFSSSENMIEIIGDGPMRDLVTEKAKKFSNIRMMGHQSQEYVISRLKKCQALIVPSIWYEIVPITILEAFSTGTPVIASKIGNLGEIISHDYNGLHFKTNDHEDLRRVIRDFKENTVKHRPLYSNAIKTYLDKYTPEINYSNLMKIYHSAIKSIHPSVLKTDVNE